MVRRRARSSALLTALMGLSLAASVSAPVPLAAQDAEPRPAGPPTATPMAEPPATPSGDGMGVRLATDKGDIVIGLFTGSSPVASENFANLVAAGYYDGLTFHRLVPGFVIQGGDPNGDGTGGPGYTIPDEPVVGRYGRGIVAMARTQEPDSQGSQFFIVLDDGAETALEHYRTYAIFGRVVEGMEVVDAIAAMPNDGSPANRALEPVAITRATLEAVELPPEPVQEPLPTESPVGDSDLEARMPAAVGDSPLSVESYRGSEVADDLDSAQAEELVALLEEVGGSLEDFSVAVGQGSVAEGFVGILAVRVSGVEAALLVDRLPSALFGVEDTGITTMLAGREVKVISPYDGAPQEENLHVFPDEDIIWMVVAPEPHLSDLVERLGSGGASTP